MQIAVIVINYWNEVCMHSCHNAVQAKCAVFFYVYILCVLHVYVCVIFMHITVHIQHIHII